MTGLGSLVLTNVRRNLARSLLTIVGMGLAALIMTTSLTLSEGYPAMAYEHYRTYCGGDIILFRDKVWVRGSDVNRSDPATWRLQYALQDIPGPAQMFLPGLKVHGAIGPAGRSRGFFSRTETDAIRAALLSRPEVTSVQSYFTLPAARVEFGGVHSWSDAYLRAWPEAGQWADFSTYIVKGRALAPDDEGRSVCLVDADRARLGQASEGRLPPVVPEVGSTVQVLVPRLVAFAGGHLKLDYLNCAPVELTVVGHYSVPSREASWMDPQSGGDSGPAPPETEQLYLTSPELFVPWQTAEALLAEVSGGAVDIWAQAMTIELDNVSRVETLVGEIAAEFPELCPVSVPRLASVANAQWLPEPTYRAPESEWRGAALPGQVGEPVRISDAFSVIFFAVAALLAAANGIVLVIERQREIAILKAVGAFSRDVIMMILAEVVMLATIGAVAGFSLAESLAIWNLISNKAGLGAIVVSVGSDLIKVLGVTVVFAVIFGLAPALRTTGMTAMEVLRRE